MVVVERDKPQGLILWANQRARQCCIYPGMRYAMGLSLSGELRGGVVAKFEIDEAVRLIAERLWQFSPQIEPSDTEPGVVWLDASGLQFIFPSLETWAVRIRDCLREMGYSAIVAVGFSRFGSYATARASQKNRIFTTAEEEHAEVARVPLVRLHLEPRLIETLFKLGIETLGGFIALPAAGLVRRFGAEAGKLHGLARGEGWDPLSPTKLREPNEARRGLDYPENDSDRLLAVLALLLQSLLGELVEHHEQLAALRFTLKLDNGSEHQEEITPAAPTLAANDILALCRLRLETLNLDAGVVEVQALAVGVARSEQQDFLFAEMSALRFEAAEKALAKIRAEFGTESVVYAQLHDGHMPEARYSWEPLQHLGSPKPSPALIRPLVRRIYHPPIALPYREHREPDGWLVAGLAEGPVEEVIGPHHLNGGWWLGEVTREYYDVRTRSGRWLSIYYDRKRRRWFLQGETQ